MKRLLILPITLLASLNTFSCSDGIGKYKVSDEEMEQILKLEGVEVMQSKIVGINSGGQEESSVISTQHFSPNAYYSIRQIVNPTGESFEEKYVFKRDEPQPLHYEEYKREDPNKDFDYDKDVTSSDFEMIENNIRQPLLDAYYRVKEAGLELVFNNKEKCYISTYSDPTQGSAEVRFYFRDKKIVKWVLSSGTSEFSTTTSFEFTYDDIIPEPPVSK